MEGGTVTRIIRALVFIVPALALLFIALVFTTFAYALIYGYRWTLTDLASRTGNWSLRLSQRVEEALERLQAAIRIIAERLRG